jgi:NTP pyrophosphatase (non-canonical NTP hydrolase)
VDELQARLAERYREGDAELGRESLATVLVEEVGELATAVRRADDEALGREVADVAFLALCLANLAEVDLGARIREAYLEAPKDEVAGGWEPAAREAHGVDTGNDPEP